MPALPPEPTLLTEDVDRVSPPDDVPAWTGELPSPRQALALLAGNPTQHEGREQMDTERIRKFRSIMSRVTGVLGRCIDVRTLSNSAQTTRFSRESLGA